MQPPALALDLARPEPIPAEGIAAAVALLETGELFRYAEGGRAPAHVAAWESEFAAYLGRRFAVAVNSCGASLYLALHCLGVRTGDVVLVSAWTLAPVPGAVAHVGARAVMVETGPELTVDLDDLEARAREHPGSVLLLSHMRGHIADLGAVTAICRAHGLRLVEDCAHSLGGGWDGRATGTFGEVGCFSTQTYKHLNSGEGGLLVTDDEEVAARAVLASGSYRLHAQHTSRPELDVFEPLLGQEPNHSMRLNAIAAAVLRPQLELLPDRVRRWRMLHDRVVGGLHGLPGLRVPVRDDREDFVGSSLQLLLEHASPDEVAHFCAVAGGLGVHVKWFGAAATGFTSGYRSWTYADPSPLPRTDRVLAGLCDLRLPLALDETTCDEVAAILRHAHAVALR